MPAPLRYLLLSILAFVIAPAAVHAQTGSISGAVTNALTGAPIAGLDVGTFNLDTFADEGFGTTDASGAYVLTGLPPGRYAVFTLAEQDPAFPFQDEGYDNVPCLNRNNCDFPEAIDATLVNVTAGGAVANINFALDPLARVTGTVTNATTGALLPNVTVTAVIRLGNSAFTIDSATTNASGVYTLSRVPGAQVYLYTSNNQGFVNEIYGDITCIGGCNANTAMNSGTPVAVSAGQTTAARDFALTPGGAISGTTANATTGAPLANVTVQAYVRVAGGTSFISSAVSNASGLYTIGGLPTGTYFLITAGGGGGVMNELYNDILCPVTCNSILQSGEEIAVTAGQTTPGKNFALEPGGAISGTVVNQAGAPLQNVQVTAVTRIGNTNFSRGAVTNASGQYTIPGLITGTYYAYVSSVPSGQVVAEIFDNITCIGFCSAANAIATGAPIPVTQGSTTANRNFNLAYSGSITGTVTDAPSGMPITDDIALELYAQVGANRNLIATTSVNGAGMYSFSGLAPGTYFVATRDAFLHRGEVFDNIPCPSASCSSVIGAATPINVTTGAVVSGRDFALERAEILFGKVMSSATGQPLVGVTVNLYKVGTGAFSGSTTTDYRGGFGFAHLTNGAYVMFTSNTQGYRNEIYNGITCATTCSSATALASGTQIPVSGVGSASLISGVTFALEPRTDAPAAPTNFRATANGFTAQFSWTAPTPSTTGVATSYVIEAGGSPGGTLVTLPVPGSAGTSYSVPNAPAGAFYVRVRAVNAAGSSPPSNEVLLVISGAGVSPPDAPTSLIPAMSGVTGSFLTFTWSDAVTGGRPTSYLVEAGTASGRADIATLAVNTRAFTFTGVPPGFYFLRVRGVNAGGVSPPSAEFLLVVGGVASPPPPPNFNSHSVSSGTVTLAWVAPASGSPTSYIIEAGSAPGLANLATVNTGNANVTASFSGVPPGTYYVRVRAVNAIGVSIVSNERTVVVP